MTSLCSAAIFAPFFTKTSSIEAYAYKFRTNCIASYAVRLSHSASVDKSSQNRHITYAADGGVGGAPTKPSRLSGAAVAWRITIITP